MTVHIKQSPGKLLLLKAEFYGMDKEIRERTSDILNFNSHKTRQIKEGKWNNRNKTKNLSTCMLFSSQYVKTAIIEPRI